MFLLLTSFIDPALQKYVNNFCLEAGKRNIQIKNSKIIDIKFPSFLEDSILKISKQKPDWSGLCLTNINDSSKFIFINATQFYYFDTVFRELLIFHELFHACFNLEHCELENSIMNEITSKTETKNYLKHRDQILDSLFYGIEKNNPTR